MVRPYKKISCFPSQRASLLESASRKILFFISLNLMYLALQFIVFWWKEIHFVLYFNKNTFVSYFTICFYDRNTFLMICGKYEIIPVSKISIWSCRKDKNKNENRTRASIFQFSIFRGRYTRIFLSCLSIMFWFRGLLHDPVWPGWVFCRDPFL